MRLNDVAIILTIIVAIIAISTFLAGVWDPPQPTPEPTPTPVPTPTPTPVPTPTPTPIPVQPPTPLYPPYTLPPTNNPPAAFVDSINPNPARQGQSVTFSCHGDESDSGDYITEYIWDSSIDGFLSNQKTFSISSLSLGLHQIILRVKDSHGQWSSEITRNLRVEAIEIPSTEIDDTTPEHVPSITPTPTLKPTLRPTPTPKPEDIEDAALEFSLAVVETYFTGDADKFCSFLADTIYTLEGEGPFTKEELISNIKEDKPFPAGRDYSKFTMEDYLETYRPIIMDYGVYTEEYPELSSLSIDGWKSDADDFLFLGYDVKTGKEGFMMDDLLVFVVTDQNKKWEFIAFGG